MDDILYYNSLYDLYGILLTDKQREYFEDYYFHNLSFSEMAEDYDVSRNAAFKQVHIVIDKLEEYESKLKLYEKKMKITSLVNGIQDSNLKERILELL